MIPSCDCFSKPNQKSDQLTPCHVSECLFASCYLLDLCKLRLGSYILGGDVPEVPWLKW